MIELTFWKLQGVMSGHVFPVYCVTSRVLADGLDHLLSDSLAHSDHSLFLSFSIYQAPLLPETQFLYNSMGLEISAPQALSRIGDYVRMKHCPWECSITYYFNSLSNHQLFIFTDQRGDTASWNPWNYIDKKGKRVQICGLVLL